MECRRGEEYTIVVVICREGNVNRTDYGAEARQAAVYRLKVR